MKDNFAACLAETEMFEGGFSNNPHDPGGATYKGVTQRVYDAWRRKQGSFLRSVRQASDDEIATIYKAQYWDAVRGDELYPGLDMICFDEAVNAGPVRSIKTLQQALGVTVDGMFGLETLGALQMQSADAANRKLIIQHVCDLRFSFWRSLPTWVFFKLGWTDRGNGVEAKALAMVVATA